MTFSDHLLTVPSYSPNETLLYWRREKQQEQRHGKRAYDMKKTGYIFVDDGSPEASDYDNNYVGYDVEETGSYERAVEEAKRRCWSRRRPPPAPSASLADPSPASHAA